VTRHLERLFLVPLVGDFPARQIGVPNGWIVIIAVAYIFIRWIAAETTRQLLVSALWVILTVLF
jgi:hypothetical protein